jgi:hypothetical protein
VSVAVSVNDDSFSPVSIIGQGFEFYKYEKLDISVDPIIRFETSIPQNGTSGSWTLGYHPEVTTSATTTIDYRNVATLPDAVTGTASIVDATTSTSWYTGQTVNKTLRVMRKTLNLSEARMFRTAATTEDTGATQGQLIFAVADSAGANTVILRGIVKYRVRFFEPLNTAAISSRRYPPVSRLFGTFTGASPSMGVSEDEEKSQCAVLVPPPQSAFTPELYEKFAEFLKSRK